MKLLLLSAFLLSGCSHLAKLERTYSLSYSDGDSTVTAGATFKPMKQK